MYNYCKKDLKYWFIYLHLLLENIFIVKLFSIYTLLSLKNKSAHRAIS